MLQHEEVMELVFSGVEAQGEVDDFLSRSAGLPEAI
jgi:hypothetical protein